MCGIYGSTIKYETSIFQKKMDIFKFRGPDYTGIKSYKIPYGELIFGHNRLAIIDLENRSNQPFDYSDELSIVFNGEIYNFQELKQIYLSEFSFKTTSDTEVLCAMYKKFGTNCTQYLNGMFAFVIYDRQKQLLFGARDRLGKKPFFYHCSERGFEFASQLFPLCIGNDYTIDKKARKFYFLLQYVPDPYSIFKEIKKLKAGEQFEYYLVKNQMYCTKYWDIDSNSEGYIKPHSYEEAIEVVDNILIDSVSKRLVADVPVGIFLSGGIDSSLIASYVSKINPEVEAFSIGFNESTYDESSYSKSVAEQLNLKYHSILCDSNAALEMLNSFSIYYDEPMGDSSSLPTSLLAKHVRKKVTVALGGDGGDEVFWGYNRYLDISKYKNLFKIPFPIRKTISYFLGQNKYSEVLLLNNIRDLYAYRLSYYNKQAFNFNTKECFYSLDDIGYLYKEEKCEKKSLSDFDLKTYLNYDINTKVDRATMRSALELRSPLMDYRLIEYSRLLPLEYMYTPKDGQKRILRELLYRNVSKDLFIRNKQGFGIPLNEWLRHELKDLLVDTINKENLRQLPELNTSAVIRLRDRHLNGEANYGAILWYLLVYLIWYDFYKSVIKRI